MTLRIRRVGICEGHDEDLSERMEGVMGYSHLWCLTEGLVLTHEKCISRKVLERSHLWCEVFGSNRFRRALLLWQWTKVAADEVAFHLISI